MLKNITKNPAVLAKESGILSVFEFVHGFRLYITVNEEGMKIEQDDEFNAKTFGRTLNLDQVWENIQNVYNITEERLLRSPIFKYKLNCILYDSDISGDIAGPQYIGKGLVVVEVVPTEAPMFKAERLKEFCDLIMMPCIEPLFIGDTNELKHKFQELRNTSNISVNKMGMGIIIKNNPPEIIDGSIVRWFVESDGTYSTVEDNERPEVLAKEFMSISFPVSKISEIEDQHHCDPAKSKVEFKKIIKHMIDTDYSDLIEDYRNRCAFFLGNENQAKVFDKFLNKAITEHLTYILKEAPEYKSKKKVKRGK